jgi:DNA polymerase-3 subunit delta
MNVQDLQRHIKQDDLAPLYLILGEESYFRDQALDVLRQAHPRRDGCDAADRLIADEGSDAFQSDVVYGDETNASEILGLAEEVSLFSSRRRLFVKWADKLSARDGELLIPYFQQPNEATTVVFAAVKLDGRTKWVQALKKKALIVDCASLAENQRAGWVTQRSRECGLALEASALEMLKEQATEGLYAVMRELEKLAAYMPEGQQVKVQDVELVRGKPPEISVFDWSEAVSRGDHGRALDIVAKNLETGEAPLRMLGAFLWQMRRIWKASGLLLAGKDHGQAARQAGIPPFRAREFMQQVQRWQEPNFRHAWAVFSQADSALKGGRAVQPKLILDDLVIQLCKGKQRQPAQ